MPCSILYLGDTSLVTAASYLAGLIHRAGWSLQYVPSDQAVSVADIATNHCLFILSDYGSSQMPNDVQLQLVQRVAEGAGLLMLGGWESFCGLGGDWNGTTVGDVLPVEIATEDDRVNSDCPILLRPTSDHPILSGLPWAQRVPYVGGFNRVTPKPEATVLLEGQVLRTQHHDEGFLLQLEHVHPMLVTGEHGRGRTAVFASDVAPHWVGGLVDWGPERVNAQAPGSEAIEVGNCYAQFFQQLLAWTAQL